MGDLRSWILSARRPAALLAGVSTTLLLLLASTTDGGALPMLLAAAAVGVAALVHAHAGRQVVRPLPATAHPSGVARAVPASTAYWCAVTAPSCPRRPRAPGRG